MPTQSQTHYSSHDHLIESVTRFISERPGLVVSGLIMTGVLTVSILICCWIKTCRGRVCRSLSHRYSSLRDRVLTSYFPVPPHTSPTPATAATQTVQNEGQSGLTGDGAADGPPVTRRCRTFPHRAGYSRDSFIGVLLDACELRLQRSLRLRNHSYSNTNNEETGLRPEENHYETTLVLTQADVVNESQIV